MNLQGIITDCPRGKDENGLPLKIHTGNLEFQNKLNLNSVNEESFESRNHDTTQW